MVSIDLFSNATMLWYSSVVYPDCSGMASGGGDRLRVVTAVNLRQKMDALVSDLSHALDESQLPQYHRKRRGFKRRAKLATNLGKDTPPGLKYNHGSENKFGEINMVMHQGNQFNEGGRREGKEKITREIN